MWLNHLTHVVVLVLECECEHLLAILALEEVHYIPHKLLLSLELIAVVVADDVANLRLLDATLDAYAVEEALVVLGELWALVSRKECVKLRSDVDGVNHLVLRHAGVYITACDSNLCARSIEVLILQLTLHATIHGVCEVGSELLNIEVVYATANLLVGSEAHANLAMWHLGVCHEPLHGCYDLGYTRLVVSTEERSTIGVNEGVALEEWQLGELLNAQPYIASKQDVAAVVVLNNMGLNIRATHVGSGIDMRDKADNGGILIALSCGERTHNIAILVHCNLLEADCLELLLEVAQQHELLLG